ncbi:hypothetical protein O7614_26845 [Micromonospora sp. WMMD961]|uniref:hypothetical protein n=1 Tax=Micromonospora sp. WMMD961 TaxID=3016100 RepID=UPI002417F626|nr:hypothetical protein [Micromonospora sp. WMMD961]MDG4783282.1 hypothetical protein [Micromonospora sp. WMMD961]
MPVWLDEINLTHAPEIVDGDFGPRRNAFVEAIKASEWYEIHGEGSTLHWYVREIEDAQVISDFALYMEGVYNVADEDRVWIKTL